MTLAVEDQLELEPLDKNQTIVIIPPLELVSLWPDVLFRDYKGLS